MSPTPNEKPEGLPEQADELEKVDFQITSKREQIAALQSEIRELQQRRRDLERLPTLVIPLPPSMPVNEQVRESNPDSPVTIRLLLACLAFILAGLGQRALHIPLHIGTWIVNGWIFYAIAVVFFLIAFHRITFAHFSKGDLANRSDDSFHPASLFWVLLILSSLVLTGSLFLFNNPDQMANAWRLQILSVLLFIAAFIRFDRLTQIRIRPALEFNTSLLRWLPIIGVLALASVVRFWHVAQVPFGTWADEAFNGNLASEILHNPTFRPVFYEADTLPSHLAYLFALSFRFFGTSTAAMRYVTAAFGVITVLLAYLLFRRWFNEGVALMAAFLFAVLRYDITFSRIAMHGVTTPAFELAVLYLLDRALERKGFADFAWLGLVMGLGLGFYTPFRLFVVIILLFLLVVAVIKMWRQRRAKKDRLEFSFWDWPLRVPRWELQFMARFVIVLMGILIVISPLIQFAINKPKIFAARLSAASIFVTRDEPDLAKALWNNTAKHLVMFNVQGDPNGRHNWPRQPMLDSVMGALFILGLGHALWRWRDLPNLLMLLIFFLMNLGGILSLDFEAPQSLRVIGVMPALVYFCVLPIAFSAHEFSRFLSRHEEKKGQHTASSGAQAGLRSAATLIPLYLSLLAVFATIAYLNINTYFNKQEPSPDVWAVHSTAETIASKEMKRLAGNNDILLSALYENHPTVRFLAGDVTNVQRWTTTDRLPFVHDNNGRGIVMLFDEKLNSAYREAKQFYPHASFIEHRAPAGGGVVLWEVILTPDDLRSVQGVTARYFQGNSVEGKPVKEATLSQISLDWSQAQGLVKPLIAELRTTLHVLEYGSYRFSLRGEEAGGRLWIDENPVTDAPLTLARGNHALRLQASSGPNQLELWWQPPSASEMQPVPAINLFRPPVTNNGLLGTYYPSPDWSGEPAFMQIDPQIDYYFHITPLPRPYTVAWTGKLYALTPGTYQFALSSVDNSQLRLDGSLVVDNPNGHTKVEGNVTLTQGWHDIDVRFADKTGGTQIYLYWMPPGSSEQVLVPTKNLLPPMGHYPANVDALKALQP